MQNEMATHSRAKAGGEFGANGEFYKGGAFINTVPENPKGNKLSKKTTRKQEVMPYVWEIAPEGKMSLYRMLSGFEVCVSREPLQFAFNADLGNEYATAEYIEIRKARIAAFNVGQRWI